MFDEGFCSRSHGLKGILTKPISVANFVKAKKTTHYLSISQFHNHKATLALHSNSRRQFTISKHDTID
jgi:hypothetical protein